MNHECVHELVHCQMLFDITVGTKSLEYREGNDIRWMSVCDFMCNSIYVCESRSIHQPITSL